MKKYFIDFGIGFSVGIFFIILPLLFTYPDFGIPGIDILFKLLPILKENISLIGVPYTVLSLLPFLIYILHPFIRRDILILRIGL